MAGVQKHRVEVDIDTLTNTITKMSMLRETALVMKYILEICSIIYLDGTINIRVIGKEQSIFFSRGCRRG